MIANQSGQTLAKLADPSRYALILGAAWSEVWRHYGWLPVLVVGLFVCGYDRRQLPRTALGVIGVMALGYFMIYLTTPLDLAYHLGSSLYRLLLQVWPIGLLIFFAGVRAPEAWSAEVLP